jgi:hypothetical protein
MASEEAMVAALQSHYNAMYGQQLANVQAQGAAQAQAAYQQQVQVMSPYHQSIEIPREVLKDMKAEEKQETNGYRGYGLTHLTVDEIVLPKDAEPEKAEEVATPPYSKTRSDLLGRGARDGLSDAVAGCRLGCACKMHRPVKPEPYVPSVSDWDLLPDAT